jgi:hypothetical protein
VKPVLLIAYHFPPLQGSSGIQRTLSLCRHLPDFGYRPLVLSVSPRAYPQTRDDQLDRIPPGIPVVRAFGLDSARHLAIRGRYLALTARPDRWISWWLGAVPAGWRLLRRHRPAVIWSTQPIPTAHLIGLALHRHSGLPWVADFRDSMTEDDYPPDPRLRAVRRRVEQATVRQCTRASFTAPGTLAMYAARYPQLPSERWALIPNGYDEEAFPGPLPDPPGPATGPMLLVHSGLLYPNERDPRAFFRALAQLERAGRLPGQGLEIRLRAPGSEDYYTRLLADLDLASRVELAPTLPYREALREITRASGLLLFQASNCNHQIPAKLYEYLRARRPILGLTDPRGDTAGALRAAGIDTILPLDDTEAIKTGLVRFLEALRKGTAPVATPEHIQSHSRRRTTEAFARLFDRILRA